MQEIRRAYIDWKKLDADAVLENRREYMLCMPLSDGTASLGYATYYDKGTVIDVHMRDGAVPDGKEPTAEERLLCALFGACRKFVVPEDGFYRLTGDFGVDEEEAGGVFEGCREQAVCLGNRYGWEGRKGSIPVYWADSPLLPDGLSCEASDPSGHASRYNEETGRKYAEVMERIDADSVAREAYRCLCGNAVPGDDPIDFLIGQAVYSIAPYQVAMTVDSAWSMCKALSGIPETELLDVNRKARGMKTEEATAVLSDFCTGHGIPGPQRVLMFRYIDYLLDDCRSFYYYRDRQMARGGLHSLNMPVILQEAWAMSTMPYRVGRLVKLMGIGAPEIILINELRVLVQRILASRYGNRIVHVGSDFDAMYGVLPDGSRGERHCEYGDEELFFVPEEVSEEEEEAPDGECEEMELPECYQQEEEEPERVIGVDYPWFAVVAAPNFLMRTCRFVLWDNSDSCYAKDEDGQIERFQEWKDAKARSEELGRLAEEAASGEKDHE